MRPLTPARLVVFTDLDGSLLDHDTYDWTAARPAVEALAGAQVPLVLVTSKTRAEVLPLRRELGNKHPFVVENGAATYVPTRYFSDYPALGPADDLEVVADGPDRAAIAEVLAAMRREYDYRFFRFAELGPEGIAQATGLDLDAAAAANDRAASEPLLWQDSDDRLETFRAEIAARGLGCTQGGRFVHVLGRVDKADAVEALKRRYRTVFAPHALRSVAIGDGPNDLGMLNGADIAVVIRAAHNHAMPVEARGAVIRTSAPGPFGWNQAVLDLLLAQHA